MLSKLVYFMAIATALLGHANGMVLEDDDSQEAARRLLIKSRRGLQSNSDFIAEVYDGVDTGAACDIIKENITTWKKNNPADSTTSSLRAYEESEDEVTTTTIKTCFVFFSGTEELKVFVEGLPKVKSVEADSIVINDARPASWGLDRIDQEDLPLSKTALEVSHTGIGVNIYIVDTGVNEDHNDFGGRAYLMQDFTSESGGSITDGNGHGTHCSGTAAGGTYGIAREATIFGVKVLSSSGSGSTSGVIKGINWAVQHQADQYNGESAVISMSLGGGHSSSMNNAVNEAVEAGMIVVVAAGNENQDACNVSPASAGGNGANGGVITVGATTSSDYMASYSNYGECTDVFAPGSSIKSTWRGSTTAVKTISGTSMATPHVAGVAATLLEKHNKNKDAAQTELFSLLVADKVLGLEGDESPNLLLQVPTYTGPPTPPTMSPTMPPTNLPNAVCADGYCVAFEKSTFGADFPSDELISGELVSTENNLCSETDEDFTDKIVMVPRGDCLFFDKVKTAENQGAKAVIFRLLGATDAIFPANYYGTDTTKLLSVMIGYKHAQTFQNLIDYAEAGARVTAELGSLSFTGFTQAPTPYPTTAAPTPPTPEPTNSPTPAPTSYPTVSCSSLNRKKGRCKNADHCLWYQETRTCYDLSDDLPCTVLTESLCGTTDGCAWALLPEESKNAACYNADDVPAAVDDIETPSACGNQKYDTAESLCTDIDMGLCDASDLLYAEIENTCNFDNKWVWSTTSCGRNKYYQVHKNKMKVRCKKRNVKAGTRCC